MDKVEPRNRLQELREAAGMSRPGLADLLGLGETQIRRWEEWEVLIPSKHLALLARTFHVSMDHLLGLDRIPAKTGEAV